ncbi:MAG: AAC(3) family N-acetyltransferase [bacterium]|nr:AAC(3) family N-acetyltransferase [bacterium]
MAEIDIIAKTAASPITQSQIENDLAKIGVEAGMTLVVHSSLSALGWVVGGAVAVVNALGAVLGASGTLVMPTHSGDLSDPAGWCNPPVDPGWWSIIRSEMPAFDPDRTPTRGMGAVVDCFRRGPGVVRSQHPHVSFAASGKHAKLITADHELESSLAERSPLARIYELQGSVLLLGIGHESNTSLHLAESRATYPNKRFIRQGAPILIDGRRRWVEFDDLDLCSDDFPLIGAAFEGAHGIVSHRIGLAESRLLPQKTLVDFAVGWMEAHR